MSVPANSSFVAYICRNVVFEGWARRIEGWKVHVGVELVVRYRESCADVHDGAFLTTRLRVRPPSNLYARRFIKEQR